MKTYAYADRESVRRLRGGRSPQAADDWRSSAACRLLPVDEADRLFFPRVSTDAAWERAAEVCATCPVIHRCLESALAQEPATVQYVHGFRGGLSPEQRVALQRMPAPLGVSA